MSLEGKKPGNSGEQGQLPREDTVEMASDLTGSKGSVAYLKLVADNTKQRTEQARTDYGIGSFYKGEKPKEKSARREIRMDDTPVTMPKRPQIHTYPKTLTGLEAPDISIPENKEFLDRMAEVRRTGEEMVESSRPSLRAAAVPKDLYPIDDEPTLEIADDDEPTLPGKFIPAARLKTATELMQTMIDDGVVKPSAMDKLADTRPKLPTLTWEEIDYEMSQPMPENSSNNQQNYPQILPGPIAKPKVETIQPKKSSWWGDFKKVAGAAAIGLLAIFGVREVAKSHGESLGNAPVASASVKLANSAAPQEEIFQKISEKLPEKKAELIAPAPKITTPVKALETVKTVSAKTLQAERILKMSENKVLKSTLENGEFIVQADSSLLDSMLMPYVGMADQEQKVKIKQLERDVQLGLTMYMYDRFGPPEKLEASLKDPGMRNLYKTVKTWNLSNVESRLPAADVVRMKELARRIVEDAQGLGHDKAEKAERAAVINGNIFNARGIGDVVKMRFEDGRKHVLLEKMDEIFYGGISRIMDKTPATGVAAPAIAPIAPKANSQDTFLPNIAELDAIDAGWDDLPNENSDKKNGAAQKTELDEIDAGWDEISGDEQKLIDEKAEFEKSGKVKLELPKGLTTREENNLLLPELEKKVIQLMPEADRKVVERVMKQFAFRAVKSQVKNGRFVEMELNPRFREILRYELNKSKGKIGV